MAIEAPDPTIADDYVAALEPWWTEDLETYARAIASMFEGVEKYTISEWLILLDPDACPVEALLYLAQYVGEQLPTGLNEAAQRQWIKDRPNQKRGTVSSIVAVARRTLTGAKTVALRERDGDVDRIAIRTMAAETPNATVVAEQLRRDTVPADIAMDYATFSGATWADVEAGHASWSAVEAGNTNWGVVQSTLTGYQVFSE